MRMLCCSIDRSIFPQRKLYSIAFMWELESDEESFNNGADSDCSLLACEARQHNKRRPSGIFGSAVFRRRRGEILASLGFTNLDVDPGGTADDMELALCPLQDTQEVDPALAILTSGIRGDHIAGRVVEHILKVDTTLVEPPCNNLIESVLGPTPRDGLMRRTEAKQLGFSPQTFDRRILELAAGVHFASRAWANAILRRIHADVELGISKLIGTFVYELHDETPMKLCPVKLLERCNAELEDATVAQHIIAHTPGEDRGGDAQPTATTPSVCKLFQSEATVAVLTQCTEPPGEYKLIELPLNTSLQLLERCTGETTLAALQEQLHITGIKYLRDLNTSEVDTDACTADRAGANDRGEDGFCHLSTVPRMRLPCVIHMVSTAQGRWTG